MMSYFYDKFVNMYINTMIKNTVKIKSKISRMNYLLFCLKDILFRANNSK